MDQREYYEESGYDEYKGKVIKSKWFFPVIIVLIILIIIVVLFRIFIIPRGKLKSLEVDELKKIYLDETTEISAQAKGSGNISDTITYFESSSDSVAEPGQKAVLGKKITNKIYAKRIGSFTLTTYAKLDNITTEEKTTEIAVCHKLSAKMVQNDNISISYNSKEVAPSIDVYLGESKICYEGLTFESENTKVVTVDEKGNLKSIAAGTTNILLRQDGNEVKVKVTSLGTNISVKGLELDTSDVRLKVNQKKKVEFKTIPEDALNQGVTWTSSDNKVVEVSNKGILTALKKGTATITCTTKEGNFSKSFQVIVE